MSWGCPTGESEGMSSSSLLLKEGKELTSPADFLSLSFMGLGVYFPGFAGAL